MALQDTINNTLTGDFTTTTVDVKERTREMLLNGEEQIKKAVETGDLTISDSYQKISDAAPEIDVDTSDPDFNLADIGFTVADFGNLATPTGQMQLLGEHLAGDNQGLNNEEMRDALGEAAPQTVSNAIRNTGDAVNQVTDTAKDTVGKTVNNFLPEGLGKDLGKALYALIFIALIGVGVYVLSLLNPLFEIGSNVSEK